VTFKEITDKLLTLPNVSTRCNLGFVQDLHRFVYTDIEIIRTHPSPKESKQCLAIKENLLYIAKNYDNLKKNSPNIKWK